MALITCDETKFLGDACDKLLQESGIRFVGVINHLGNLIAGNCKVGVTPYEKGKKRNILYTQLILGSSMDREFDETLGSVDYISTIRENVMITSIPKQDSLIVISSEKDVNITQLVKKTKRIFELQ